MKKMYLVLVALTLAIGFSAFTPAGNGKVTDEITYQDDEGLWHPFTGTPCVGTEIPECIKMTDHGLRQLFYNNNVSLPVTRNAP